MLKTNSRAANAYLHYTTLDAVFDNKFDGLDWTTLSKAMNSIHRLCDCMSINASFRFKKAYAHDIRPKNETLDINLLWIRK